MHLSQKYYHKLVFLAGLLYRKIRSLPSGFWRKLTGTLFFSITLCVFQVAILDNFRIFGIKPDLLLIGVIICGFSLQPRWAFFSAVFAGILKFAFTPESLGANVILFLFWSFTVVRLSRKITLDYKFVYIALICIIVFLQDSLIRLFFLFLDRHIPTGVFLRIAFIDSLYSGLISPLVFKFVRFFFRGQLIN